MSRRLHRGDRGETRLSTRVKYWLRLDYVGLHGDMILLFILHVAIYTAPLLEGRDFEKSRSSYSYFSSRIACRRKRLYIDRDLRPSRSSRLLSEVEN